LDNLWIFFSADWWFAYCLDHRSWRRRGWRWRPIWMERERSLVGFVLTCVWTCVVELFLGGRGSPPSSYPCQCDWSRCGGSERWWSWKRTFGVCRKNLPSNTFGLFPVHSSLECCWLVCKHGHSEFGPLIKICPKSKGISQIFDKLFSGPDWVKQDWPSIANSFGKERGKAEHRRELSRSLNLKSIRLLVGGWHRCYFKSWGHQVNFGGDQQGT